MNKYLFLIFLKINFKKNRSFEVASQYAILIHQNNTNEYRKEYLKQIF